MDTMKKKSNLKSYWIGFNSFFHWSIISKIIRRRKFILVNKCLHLRDRETYVKNKNLLGYEKMGQGREVVDIVRTYFMRAWKLEKFLIVDEMMI